MKTLICNLCEAQVISTRLWKLAIQVHLMKHPHVNFRINASILRKEYFRESVLIEYDKIKTMFRSRGEMEKFAEHLRTLKIKIFLTGYMPVRTYRNFGFRYGVVYKQPTKEKLKLLNELRKGVKHVQ